VLDDVDCTVAQAAAYFKVSPKTVRSWISRYNIDPSPEWVKVNKHYPFKALVEAEFRARETPGGRPRKSSRVSLTSPD
jgi:uncharacterized protein YjcR